MKEGDTRDSSNKLSNILKRSKNFLRVSDYFEAILSLNLGACYGGVSTLLFVLLKNYIKTAYLSPEMCFSEAIFINNKDAILKSLSKQKRHCLLSILIREGFICKSSTCRTGFNYCFTEHYLALYFFFLQLSPKVAEKNFDVLKEKVGEIMRKRPNYEDTEAILKACVNLDSNVEVADNSAGKESAVGKKGKKILRKPKSKELKEDQWLRAVKRAFKEKALSYDKKCAEEALSKTNANLIQKSRPEDVNTFKEKADFAADAFMQYFIKEGDAVASINRFAARFSSWMHNGFKPKAEGGGKNALTTDAERQRNKERYENLMKNLGGNNSEY